MTIYFITDGKYIKIGKTKDLNQRIVGIQTGNPKKLRVIAVLEKEYYSESQLHEQFNNYRINGEWFEFCKPIMDFLYKNCDEVYPLYTDFLREKQFDEFNDRTKKIQNRRDKFIDRLIDKILIFAEKSYRRGYQQGYYHVGQIMSKSRSCKYKGRYKEEYEYGYKFDSIDSYDCVQTTLLRISQEIEEWYNSDPLDYFESYSAPYFDSFFLTSSYERHGVEIKEIIEKYKYNLSRYKLFEKYDYLSEILSDNLTLERSVMRMSVYCERSFRKGLKNGFNCGKDIVDKIMTKCKTDMEKTFYNFSSKWKQLSQEYDELNSDISDWRFCLDKYKSQSTEEDLFDDNEDNNEVEFEFDEYLHQDQYLNFDEPPPSEKSSYFKINKHIKMYKICFDLFYNFKNYKSKNKYK